MAVTEEGEDCTHSGHGVHLNFACERPTNPQGTGWSLRGLVCHAYCMHACQRQQLSAVKNRKLCGPALALKGELCGRVRRKLSNYAAKLRQIFTKSAVIVQHFQLIFGSNWLQLCINNVLGRPDQTPEHQKQQKHRPDWRIINGWSFCSSIR